MQTKTITGGTDLFYNYLSSHKDQVKSESAEGYYHVNVVADAYSKGLSDGKRLGKQDFLEQVLKVKVETFTHKSNQIYILSQNLISFLRQKDYNPVSLHISLFYGCPKVLLAVKSDLLLDDNFVELAYTKVFEYKKIYNELFSETLDMAIVPCDNLDLTMMKEDGFGYTEDL